MNKLLICTLALSVAASGFASVVFNNTTNLLSWVIQMGDTEWGDTITLAGTDRLARSFECVFYSNQGSAQTAGAMTLRFYQGGANGQAPGPMFYFQTRMSVPVANGPSTISFALPDVPLPDVMTFTLQVTEGPLALSAGPRFASPPTVGASEDYVWKNLPPNGWQTVLFGQLAPNEHNIAAKITAVASQEFVPPTSYTVTQGLNFGGSLASILTSDDQRASILNDEFDTNGEFEFTSNLPAGTVSQLKFKFEGRASRSDLSQFLKMRNYATGIYTNVNVQTATLADSIAEGSISSGVANYFSASREVKARATWIPQLDVDAMDGWVEGCDQAMWEMVF